MASPSSVCLSIRFPNLFSHSLNVQDTVWLDLTFHDLSLCSLPKSSFPWPNMAFCTALRGGPPLTQDLLCHCQLFSKHSWPSLIVPAYSDLAWPDLISFSLTSAFMTSLGFSSPVLRYPDLHSGAGITWPWSFSFFSQFLDQQLFHCWHSSRSRGVTSGQCWFEFIIAVYLLDWYMNADIYILYHR